jgi:type IV secretory pathway VirD2 relaxase
MSGDSRDWDLPIFRPQMGRRVRGARASTDLPLRTAIFLRLARGLGRPGNSGRQSRARCDVRLPPNARRCVVKARYVPMGDRGPKAARAHLAYIERDGVERDGSPGRMFGPEGEVRRDDFGAPIAGEKRQFRFIIGPEDGEALDLRDYTRRLVDRMEKDLGRKLRWAAVCHYDTDNPHVHLVVRGVDARNQELRIDRTYISESLRLRARELATRELGPRSALEVRRQLDREVSQERLTTVDRQLATIAGPERTVRLADIARAADARKLSRPHAVRRLENLERLHLAERLSPASWRLEEGWQEALKRLGERGDIIKRMHQALGRAVTTPRIFEAGSAPVEGVVRRKGLHDEQTGAPFVIVETERQEAHYVRVPLSAREQLRVGERVRVAEVPAKWVTAPDQAIAREAGLHGGIYSATEHERRLRLKPMVIAGRPVPPDAIVAVNLRRLERLARHQLVTPMPDGSWKVPSNLLDVLREREKTHPQHRIQIDRLDRTPDQARPRGPTLD